MVCFSLFRVICVFLVYDFKLSILIGISMIINMIFAGLSGIIIPTLLDKYKIDPAIASTFLLQLLQILLASFLF